MSGRFGQYEGEAEVAVRYPTRREDPPPRFSTAQLLAALLFVVALGVCACAAIRPPASDPDIRGVVTSVDGSDSQTVLLVVWVDDPTVGARAAYDAASVRTTSDTKHTRSESVEVGTIVEVWFKGPVAESYPVQATADWIANIGTYDGELPAVGL